MGVYVRDLLLGQYYFDTLFPRIPVPVMRQIVSNLEKMKLPAKHSGVTGDTNRRGSDETARRPPSVKAALSVSFGQRAPHRASTRDSSPVRRTLPSSYDRASSEDMRRSPRDRRSYSHEYSDREDRDREWERDRDQDQDRDQVRDGGRNRDSDRERDRDGDRIGDMERDRDGDRIMDRERDRDGDRIRDRGWERERERRHDYDRRYRYSERESHREYENYDGSRQYKVTSSCRSRSRSRSPSWSLQTGNARFDRHLSPQRDGGKEKTSASSNLAKLKDLYGDSSDKKVGAGSERIPRRDTGSEEVIRLGGSTWR